MLNRAFINGYDGIYDIDINGNIWSYKNSKYMLISYYREYPAITLSTNGIKKNYYIHRLVAETFIPNLYNNTKVNHIDGNKNNFNVYNLEWVSHSENVKKAYEIGILKQSKNKKNKNYIKIDFSIKNSVILNHPNYNININGEVFNNINGKYYLKKQITKSGYYNVSFGRINRLVAETFIPNPNNYPIVHHINGNRLDNNISNLCWVSAAQNTQYAVDSGVLKSISGEQNKLSKLSDIDVLEIFFATGKHKNIANNYNITTDYVCNIKKKIRRKELLNNTQFVVIKKDIGLLKFNNKILKFNLLIF